MPESLENRKCLPCESGLGESGLGESGLGKLTPSEIEKLNSSVPSWRVIDGRHLEKTFTFKNFVSGLDFVIEVGSIAEEEGHHPDIYLTWGKVKIELWTHAMDGLSENDFILASKIERINAR